MDAPGPALLLDVLLIEDGQAAPGSWRTDSTSVSVPRA